MRGQGQVGAPRGTCAGRRGSDRALGGGGIRDGPSRATMPSSVAGTDPVQSLMEKAVDQVEDVARLAKQNTEMVEVGDLDEPGSGQSGSHFQGVGPR